MKTKHWKGYGIALLVLGASLSVAGVEGAAPVPLRAGPVTMLFEPDNACLRYVKVGPHEILRGITAPVRNRFWGTVLPVVSNVKLDDRGDHFSLTFEARCREREIDFLWHGAIRGSASGEIEFTFDGTAGSTFERNRIGFCVLHGPSAAGKPWVIENVRGERAKGRFPEFISPHQPAKEIREIAHEVAPGFWAHVRMEGDTFEMEDQRNWTDASFKTYCTPLELPYPVRVAQGTRIAQKVTLRLTGAIPNAEVTAASARERAILTLARHQTQLPRIGLQVSSQADELSAAELERLERLNLDHLRVDLSLTNRHYVRQLRQAAAQARALGATLHVGVRPGPEPEAALQRLAAELKAVRPPVSVWLVIGADQSLHQLARRFLTPYRKAPVGTVHEDVSFVQLNRVRPAPGMMEVVSYGVTPQIHAFDNRSIMETLPILGDTVRSARQFVGERPLVIGPITLRPQPVTQEPLPGELPSNVDPRQPTAFAAAWTLGSLKYLAEAGVESLTYYETMGWKGIMEAAEVPRRPEVFPSEPGAVFPVYHVLSAVAEFQGGRVQRVDSSDTLVVAGLALRKGKRLRLLVANLTDQPQPAALRGLGETIAIRELAASQPTSEPGPATDASIPRPGEAAAMELPLELPPYGILQIDRTGSIP